MLMTILSLAAVAHGQYALPRVSGVSPQAYDYQEPSSRSGPYPPAQPAVVGPYPPAQPVARGPYPPAQPQVEGGEISPVEQGGPERVRPIAPLARYGAPVIRNSYPSAPGQLREGPSSYRPTSGQLREGPSSYPSVTPGGNRAPSYPSVTPAGNRAPSYPSYTPPGDRTQTYPSGDKALSYPSYSPSGEGRQPQGDEQPTSFPFPSSPSRPEPFQSGGEVSPDELEIPRNTQIKLQDKRLQYSHGFSDDKGTSVREQGSLLSTNDGWEYVVAKKGSYSYISPEGKAIEVNYIADHNGFRVLPN